MVVLVARAPRTLLVHLKVPMVVQVVDLVRLAAAAVWEARVILVVREVLTQPVVVVVRVRPVPTRAQVQAVPAVPVT